MSGMRNSYTRIKMDGGNVCAYCMCEPCDCAADCISPVKKRWVDTLCGCGRGIISGKIVGIGRCRCGEQA